MPDRLPPLIALIAAACVALLALAPMPARAQERPGEGPLDCRLTFWMEGWSAFYKTGRGEGMVICNHGQRLPVTITSRGGGITFGKSRIDNGRGEFSGIHDIRDVLGRYAAAEAHVAAGRARKAQVVTKGAVSLALTGTGSGWDIGVSIGSFVISEP
ncbi:hypothetical protein [Luteimonas sp. e5]